MKKDISKKKPPDTKARVKDEEQSGRFIEEARKILPLGAFDMEFNNALDVILRKPVKPDQSQGNRTSRKKPE